MVAELAQHIENWLNGGKHRSLHSLATDSGVSYMTLRRIMQDEVKTVAFENAVAILGRFMEKHELMAFLKKHYPESAKWFSEMDSALNMQNIASQDIIQAAFDFSKWIVICLSNRDSGASRDELRRFVGDSILDGTIKDMLDASLIEIKDELFHLVEKNFNPGADAHFAIAQLRHMTAAYSPARRSEPGHMLASATMSLNLDGLKELQTIMRESAIKISKLENDPKFKGNSVSYWGIIGGTLTALALLLVPVKASAGIGVIITKTNNASIDTFAASNPLAHGGIITKSPMAVESGVLSASFGSSPSMARQRPTIKTPGIRFPRMGRPRLR